MHVMHLIDSMHGGGAESSILEVAPDLLTRGIETSIISLLPDDGALEERLGSLGIPHIRLHRQGPFGTMRQLRRIIRSQTPDLLHTTLLFSNLAGRVSALGTRMPVVTTLANLDYGLEHKTNSPYGSWAVRAVHCAEIVTAPLTTRFHAISEEVARVMGCRLRIPRDRIQVVYRGRDPVRLGSPTLERRIRVRASLSLDPETPIVLSIGRLDRQKGVDMTIEGFRHLVTHMPDAILIIAGRPGNASSQIEAAAASIPGVRLLGHRTDVPDLMCAADVLSFPSRWEGLGGTLVEALALRLPIVASDIAPIAEVIGDVGWPLVRAEDPRDLAARFASVIKENPDIEAKKAAGVRRFEKVFTASAAAEGMSAFYKCALRNDECHL